MSLLDTASLLLTPNAYKEGKLYSVIPSDGSGDMSVTRATTATRVNSAGLVELVPYNLLLDTNTFSSWNLEGGTLTSGQIDPLGGNSAYKYVQASGGLYSDSVLDSNQTKVTYSFWAKSVYGGNLNMVLADGGGYNSYGTITINGTWTYYTFTLDRTYPSAGGMYLYGISNSQGFYIWHPQINVGTSAKEYFPTTDRLDVPRLDYSNGTCPSLLVEPQRTNLLTYSSSFDNAAWTKGDSSISANNIASPSGVQDADLLTENTANNAHVIYRSVTGTSNTFSFYAKPNGRNWLGVLSNNGDVTFFNIANGTLGTIAATSTATIEDAGNGWYRCTVYNTHPTFGASIYLSTGNGITDYLGNGTSGVYIWGAQIEAGSYQTSYIPTTSASVTRNADVISKTGISSLIGQTEGTIFLDIVFKNPLSSINRLISITETVWSSGGSIRLEVTSSQFVADIVNGGASVGAITHLTSVLPNTRYKIAIAYKQNDCKMYINGVDVGSDTTTTAMPTCSELYLNNLGGTFSGPYEANAFNTTALWKTRLTNDQLAQLTTI